MLEPLLKGRIDSKTSSSVTPKTPAFNLPRSNKSSADWKHTVGFPLVPELDTATTCSFRITGFLINGLSSFGTCSPLSRSHTNVCRRVGQLFEQISTNSRLPIARTGRVSEN